MPTRNVVLTDHQTALVEELVHSGRYQNASEVLREGLRLVEQRETEQALRLQELRQAVELGLKDTAEGRVRHFENPQALQSHLAQLTQRAVARS